MRVLLTEILVETTAPKAYKALPKMKCREKACIFLAVYGELCRQHYEDSKALASIMPSTMIILLRNPSGVMRGSWEEYQAHGE